MMKPTMNTPATDDRFNRSTFSNNHSFIANNKLDVVLERFTNLRGSEVERVIRILISVMAEADRHLADGDQYFEYSKDKIDAKVRIDLLISLLYKKEGNIEEIMNSVCFRNGRTEALELSDHYWAFCK